MQHSSDSKSLYIVLISLDGLIRGQDPEIGRDEDTGAQVDHVLNLARALARRPEVERVDLFTRLIEDPMVDADYARPIEELGDGARIVRLKSGPPEEYLPKEELWDRLDVLADNAVNFLRQQVRMPDILHSHYADAAYMGDLIAHRLGLPLIHTGHRLGRVRRRRLRAMGLSGQEIEDHFDLNRQIAAEEAVFITAQRIIALDRQQVEDDYELYDNFRADQIRIMPPGVDRERFFPAHEAPEKPPVVQDINRFLHAPGKPMILCFAPLSARNNLSGLIRVYGESPELQDLANLVVFAGERDDIIDMDADQGEILTTLLQMIDLYDLYGRVAYPKHPPGVDSAALYRFAAAAGSVIIDPSLTDPDGGLLIAAAACGLPLIATRDPVSQDIIGNCRNGVLVDPQDRSEITEALIGLLTDDENWKQCSENGIAGVEAHHSWQAHARLYLNIVNAVLEGREQLAELAPRHRAHPNRDRVICTDLDQTLLGDDAAIADFVDLIRANRNICYFGIVTGRRLDSALNMLRRHNIPEPDFLITSGGSQIHYAPRLDPDRNWSLHIDHLWAPHVIRRILSGQPGLTLQPAAEQSRFKISYYIDPEISLDVSEINRQLGSAGLSASVIMSFGQYLDILPLRASKGFALRYISDRWGIPLDHILVAGGSGADEDMMRGNTLAVVVANRHDEELSNLTEMDRIYFARQSYARGILEAIEHYDFLGEMRRPEPLPPEPEPQAAGPGDVPPAEKLFLCTDLDRTLLPNGPQPESPQARDYFARLVNHANVRLAYVSGRHHELVSEAIQEYDLPVPDYAITDVGTKIYECRKDWREVKDWETTIARDWGGRNADFLAGLFEDISSLRLQGPSKQNTHKLSYYVDLGADQAAIDTAIRSRLHRHDIHASLIWSADETAGVRLLDILPRGATKLEAIEFLARRLGFERREVVFSGDSGNDLPVMASSISSVLVANAFAEVRQAAVDQARNNDNEDRLYLASGEALGMNGNYGAGIVEGVLHFHPQMRAWLEQD
ncbi:MAG: HAD family hydrolase [Hyphomicrobiales bacterium]|nr:MAG: HAD family hydrolase [Hyphomicrobiales bacterium]